MFFPLTHHRPSYGPRRNAVPEEEDHKAKRIASSDWMARKHEQLLFARPLMQLTEVIFDVAE